MTVTVCSGFAPAGYREYGYNFIKSFDAYWPRDTDLIVYTEQDVPMPRGLCRSLWDCDGARDFHIRHNDDPKRRGTLPIPGWRQKDHKEGYSWRFDAAKFYKQCLIPFDASKSLYQDDILIWLDADVITFDKIPNNFISDMIVDTDLIFFGRGSYHSEIGFWGIRICKQSRAMLQEFAETYTNDSFLNLREHHSAYVFDHVRRNAERRGLRSRNLTPGGGGHVWLASPLAKYTDHLKGSRRKRAGYSIDHPLKWWQRSKQEQIRS
jgi:hypothetical protein